MEKIIIFETKKEKEFRKIFSSMIVKHCKGDLTTSNYIQIGRKIDGDNKKYTLLKVDGDYFDSNEIFYNFIQELIQELNKSDIGFVLNSKESCSTLSLDYDIIEREEIDRDGESPWKLLRK